MIVEEQCRIVRLIPDIAVRLVGQSHVERQPIREAIVEIEPRRSQGHLAEILLDNDEVALVDRDVLQSHAESDVAFARHADAGQLSLSENGRTHARDRDQPEIGPAPDKGQGPAWTPPGPAG